MSDFVIRKTSIEFLRKRSNLPTLCISGQITISYWISSHSYPKKKLHHSKRKKLTIIFTKLQIRHIVTPIIYLIRRNSKSKALRAQRKVVNSVLCVLCPQSICYREHNRVPWIKNVPFKQGKSWNELLNHDRMSFLDDPILVPIT